MNMVAWRNRRFFVAYPFSSPLPPVADGVGDGSQGMFPEPSDVPKHRGNEGDLLAPRRHTPAVGTDGSSDWELYWP